MSANKKRRKLPEEDLAAAVAEIINSPITRSNLSFLRPLPAPPSEDEPIIAKPMGVEEKPTGIEPQPVGRGVSDRGSFPPPAADDLLLPPEPLPIQAAIPEGVGVTPMGVKPMGVEVSPTGLGVPPHRPPAVAWQPSPSARTLWQAEGLGTFIESSRVRRITQAQDALSLVEERVYDLLWGTKNQRRDEFRLVHYSLQRIAVEARINIKTVRELIPRLIEKGFIHVEHEADARRNIPTLYKVSSYAAVLNDQRRRDRLYAAKTGKGVVYVHAVSASLGTIPLDTDSTPMGFGPPPMGVPPTGVDLKPTGTTPTGGMGADVSKPMGSAGSPSISGIYTDSKSRQTTSPVTFAALVRGVQDALGVEPDTALLNGIIDGCHQNAIQTTGEPANEDELLYFTTSKARVISKSPNIRNHLAVLRKAVPECFLGESFRAYRAAAALRRQRQSEAEQRTDTEQAQRQREAAEAEARHALWARVSESHRDERGYDMEAIAADPGLDEMGRQQARVLRERLGRFTRSGL